MLVSDGLPRLLVRLPVDVKEWVAQEALDRGCSMNAVIVEALNAKITSVFGETQNKKHAAAIKAVIDIEQLPKGTAILMPPSHRQRETDLLVRRPADVDYGLLARVSGEDATYAEDDVPPKPWSRCTRLHEMGLAGPAYHPRNALGCRGSRPPSW